MRSAEDKSSNYNPTQSLEHGRSEQPCKEQNMAMPLQGPRDSSSFQAMSHPGLFSFLFLSHVLQLILDLEDAIWKNNKLESSQQVCSQGGILEL